MQYDMKEDPRLSGIRILLDQSNYSQVIRQGQKWLSDFPLHAPLRAMLSIACQHLGRKEEALNYSEEAIGLDALDAHCLFVHAKALILNGRSSEAIEFIERSIAREPSNAACLGLKAASLLDRGKVSEANALLADALRLDPENESCLNLKMICRQLAEENDLTEEEGFSQSAGHLNASGFYTRGYQAYLSGKPDEAIHHLKQSLHLDPSNEYTKKLLAESSKMKFSLYKSYVLFHQKNVFGKKKAPDGLISFIMSLSVSVYIFTALFDFMIHPTGIDRFYLLTFPFILFASAVTLSWLFHPLSNLLLLRRPELWMLLEEKSRRNTYSVAAGLTVVLSCLVAGMYLDSEVMICAGLSLLLLTVVYSGATGNRAISKGFLTAERWTIMLGVMLTTLAFLQLLSLKIITGIFLLVFYAFILLGFRKK